jgi:hypothetical protein
MVQIENVKIPILLPKRGKGHQEILASFAVSTNTSMNPLEFVPFITSCASKTCMLSDMVDLSRSLMKELHLNDITVRTTFSYILDRVSPNLSPTFFSLPCFYERKVPISGSNTSSLGIVVPIQVNLGKPLSASLTLQIERPKKVFFEDIVDHVYKSLRATLQPPVSGNDIKTFTDFLEPCYVPNEVLNILRDTCKQRKFGQGGVATVRVSDLYQIYKLTYSKSWKGK